MEECSRDPMLDKMMVSLLLEYAEKFADLIVLNKEACKKVLFNNYCVKNLALEVSSGEHYSLK